jgi:hypothetical protein
MRNIASRIMTTLTLAAAILASAPALAYTATVMERAELARLTPQRRKQVEARLTGEQTVRGVLDTMLLNNISLQFASDHIVAVDFDREIAVVHGKNGQMMAFPIDVTTLLIKK